MALRLVKDEPNDHVDGLEKATEETVVEVRTAARRALRVVDLAPELKQRINDALHSIELAQGGETTILRILQESNDAQRQDVINFVGDDFLEFVRKKISHFVRELETQGPQTHVRAALIPMELATFATYAERVNPKLANHYRVGFLELYTQIMGNASDEELRKDATGFNISADWPSYCTTLKLAILNPVFDAVAKGDIPNDLENAFLQAEPTMRRFDDQKRYTGVTLLQPENILGEAQVINFRTHPLSERNPDLNKTYRANLVKYFNLAQ